MGSTLNGSDLPVLEERSLEEISLATYLHPTFLGDDTVRDTWVKVASQPATIRMFGAGSVDLAQAASGCVGAWMQHSVADWDWLPGKALVEGPVARPSRSTRVEKPGAWRATSAPRRRSVSC